MTEATSNPLNHDLAETALCIWEWMLDCRDKMPFDKLFTDHGTSAMRCFAIDMTPWVSAVYLRCIEGDELLFDSHSFDWDVVPSIVDHCSNESGPILAAPYPDIDETARRVIAALGCTIPPYLLPPASAGDINMHDAIAGHAEARKHMPATPDGFEDRTWRNDTAPSFGAIMPKDLEHIDLRIWVHHPDPAERECPDVYEHRFDVTLFDWNSCESTDIMSTDDWGEALAAARAALEKIITPFAPCWPIPLLPETPMHEEVQVTVTITYQMLANRSREDQVARILAHISGLSDMPMKHSEPDDEGMLSVMLDQFKAEAEIYGNEVTPDA